MSEAELRFGAIRSVDPSSGLARVDAFLSAPIEVLPFDSIAARAHAELRYAMRAQQIGERDLVIASVAVACKLTLVTGNRREFARVPGLSLADWPVP